MPDALGGCIGPLPRLVGPALSILLVFDSHVASANRRGDRLGANLDRLLGHGLGDGFADGLANGIANTGSSSVAHVAKSGPLWRCIECTGGGHGLEIGGGLVSLVDGLLGGEDVFVARNDRSSAEWALWL